MLFLFFIRFFLFNLYESPKYLMGRGREKEAVEVVHKVAAYNGKTSNLSLHDLERPGAYGVHDDLPEALHDTSAIAAIRRQLRKFSGDHIRALFATRKLAWSTSLLIVIWGQPYFILSCFTGTDLLFIVALIGLAFPLYNSFVTYYLATRGAEFGDGSVYITCTSRHNHPACCFITHYCFRADRNVS